MVNKGHPKARSLVQDAVNRLLGEYRLNPDFAGKPEREQIEELLDAFLEPIRKIATGIADVVKAVGGKPDPGTIFTAAKQAVEVAVDIFVAQNDISKETLNGFWYGVEDTIKAYLEQ